MTDKTQDVSALVGELHAVARTLREEVDPFHVNAPDLHMTSSLAERICREAAQAIASLSASPDRDDVLEEAWQPIETAPKDGTRILAWAYREGWQQDGPAQVVSAWHSGRWCIMGATGRDRHWPDVKDSCNPTHWMPLPPPPRNLKGDRT